MSLSWDEEKRTKTMANRGLDFARCEEVFSGPTLTIEDDRHYDEQRFITTGLLDGNIVVIVHTERDGDSTRIISMRAATKQEIKKYEKELG